MKNIIVAEAQGFCWGVRRALDIVDQYDEVSILGDLIHNKQVVQELENKNKRVIQELTGKEKNPIVITAHGTDISNIKRLESLEMETVDTTCPLVSVIYRAGKQLETEGYQIIIIGDKRHVEVKGIASRMKNPIMINDEDDLENIDLPEKVGIICQSTFSQNKFNKLVERIKKRVKSCKIKNTICAPTIKRQIAAETLAKSVDLMIVVGGYHSSNTKKLAELANQYVRSYHIETAEHLDPLWFEGMSEIGIIAGASTADWIIEEVCVKIGEFDF
ncbi:MAG: 4-hydroxy-3-methylbut-2-enyl diphosphate reductase [Deltaproteobacteria bacterium]|nr:4-hydroxy-3-methylbut-2-enyl diphosphate reductase [Deltaproteobacteria bacterium]